MGIVMHAVEAEFSACVMGKYKKINRKCFPSVNIRFERNSSLTFCAPKGGIFEQRFYLLVAWIPGRNRAGEASDHTT